MHRCLALAVAAALVVAVPARADEAGRQYALLVGVQDYTGTQLNNLRHAENDVTALADLLRTKGGYRLVTLLTVTKAFEAKKLDQMPTAANVRAHLKALLADRQPGDTVLVAFAGHGVALKGTGDLFFCPQGADLNRPKETLVSLTEVYDAMKRSKAGIRLLVVDACRNEPTATRAGRPALELESETRPELPKPPEGVAALFSCSTGEVAFESRKHPHGVFFHHLLDGLNGKAVNKRGQVLLESLVGYVKSEMADTLLEEFGPNARQRPHLLGDLAGEVAVLHGRSAAQMIESGVAFYNKNEFARAIADFTAALRTEPRNARAYRLRGDAYESAGEYDKAVADYTEAIRLEPTNSTAYHNRGFALRKKGDFDAAIADYTEAIRLDPKDATTYHNRAVVHDARGDHDRTIADCTEALRIDPTYGKAFVSRGYAYAKKNDFDKAIADFTADLRLEPKNANALCHRGDAYESKGEYDKAIADYTEAIGIDPRMTVAYNNRGFAYRKKLDYDRAIYDYTEAIRLDPKYADAYRNRGYAYKAKNDAARSDQDFAKYKELTGKEP